MGQGSRTGYYCRHACHSMLVLLSLLLSRTLPAQEPLVIGMVSGQLPETTIETYQPFIRYLEREIPGTAFTVRPLDSIESLIDAVREDRLDFAFITPVALVQLHANHPVRPLATVTQQVGDDVYPTLAGSVFIKDTRNDIRSLRDIRGQRIVALSPLALGGWQAAVREWRTLGIDPLRDAASVDFVFSYAGVMEAVCTDRADIGIIAAFAFLVEAPGCEETMRVLPPPPLALVQNAGYDYPVSVSTRLYPEVGFAAVGDLEESLVRRVALALLNVEAGSDVARAISVAGFTSPLNYDPVAALMLELRLPPYHNIGNVTLNELLSQYRYLLLALALAVALVVAYFYIRHQMLNLRLRQSELFQQQIFDRSKFPVAVMDPDTVTFVDVNAAALEIYGLRDRSEIIGKSPMVVSAPAQYDGLSTQDNMERLDDRLHGDSGPVVFDWLHQRPNGEFWDAEIHVIPFTNGTRNLFQMTLVDITERKRNREERERMEQQLRHAQRLESIGRLSGAIAHDFNNLLTVINGYCELLLLTTDPDHPHRDTYMQITQSCWRARELTYQLLTFSRRQITRMQPVDVNKIVLDSASMFRSLLGENIRFTTALDSRIGLTLADAGQLHQVLMNFVVNAKDAMPGGGEFSLHTDIRDIDENEAASLGITAGRYITLLARDTGTGMSEETKEKVFEPFFTTKGEKGNGFGLATTYGIIRQCRGAVTFSSKLGIGTTFFVYLPATDLKPEAQLPAAVQETELAISGEYTILVVEDQPDVRMFSCSVLESAGYRVLQAESGNQALEIARSHTGEIDLLFTDVVLGGMNGRELAECFQREFPGIRILFTSGYADDEVALYGVIQDRIAFLSKPYSPHDLLRKLRKVLEQSRENEPLHAPDQA